MRRNRTTCTFSDSFHYRLNMYTLAASAAGVGILALAQPAEAKIIYTKTHTVIAGGKQYYLDLNHDKIADFTIVNFWTTQCPDSCGQWLYLKPPAGNSEIGSVTNNRGWHFARALSKGSAVGPKGHFLAGTGFMAAAFSTQPSVGAWRNVTNRYLGLKFQINGKTHYGWARLNVTGGFGTIAATLTGYAYETIPNKPIIAGKTNGPDVITVEPTTLGSLALGRR
jgi:hypothetical protein